MNNQLMEKVIKTNNVNCPDFVFSNPLLDRNVAKTLSKSFVEMFLTSRQTSNVHNSLRHTVLNNVRKLCKIVPENHLKVREDCVSVLSECYIENIRETSEDAASVEKQLDVFLTRRLNELNYTAKFKSDHNPEVIQALINLNPSHITTLTKNVLNWTSNNKSSNILSNLWTSNLAIEEVYDNLSVKIKAEIEKVMLHKIHLILTDREIYIEDIFGNDNSLKHLIAKCSASCNCFQMCSRIMNYLFIRTNFDPRIETFIAMFVKNVKQCCTKTTFSVLYPTHLGHIALLLDFDLSKLNGSSKLKYIDKVINYFHDLCEKSENDLIMLLSHFPQWFDEYFVRR